MIVFKATPKQSNQKRQSLYVRRLRPQSVLDGLTSDDIPDLLPKADSSKSGLSSIDSSLLTGSTDKLEHLAKTRPKKPKTRAPTRVAIISNTQNAKLDKNDSNNTDSTDKVSKLDEGLETFFKKNSPSEPPLKPQIQPRVGLFKKLGIKSDYHSNLTNSKSSDSKRDSNNETMTSSVAQTSLLSARIDEVTRSRSSPNLNNKRVTQPIPIPRNTSPGAEEITNILESHERMTSPLPSERADLLAEMRAKQGRRSLAPTPTTPPITTSTESNANNANNAIIGSNPLLGVKLRATVFGDILKSPNKIQSTANEELSTSLTDSNRSSLPRQSNPPPLKQRPKSVVGLIGAKFELSSNTKEEKIDNELEITPGSDFKPGVKRSGILSKSRSNSTSSNSSTHK